MKRPSRAPKDYRLVLVEWLDASNSHSQWNDSEVDAFGFGLLPLLSVGFIVREKKDYILLAIEKRIKEQQGWRFLQAIPRNRITRIVELQEVPNA